MEEIAIWAKNLSNDITEIDIYKEKTSFCLIYKLIDKFNYV